MSTINQPEVLLAMTPAAVVEVKKFMVAENVAPDVGGLRVSVQPGGCSGFKYSLLIEDKPADDDTVVAQDGFNVFVDPFSVQYLGGMTDDRLRDVDAGLRLHLQEPQCDRWMRLR